MEPILRKPFGATLLRRALLSGSTASLLSALAVAWRGHAERAGAWRGINAVSHWRWGERAFKETKPSLRYTLPAVIVHHASSIFWAAIYERWLRRDRQQQEPALAKKIIKRAAGVTALAWFVDFHLTPKRLTPGFERVISKPSLIMTYAAFGCGLSALGLLSAYRKKRVLQQRLATGPALNAPSQKSTARSQKLPEHIEIPANPPTHPAERTPPLH